MLPAVEGRTQDLASDKAALVALYNATGGPYWQNNTTWPSSEPVGDWRGVTVSNGRVDGLYLYDNELTGTFPTQLGNLSQLTYLELHNNPLTGAIPTRLKDHATLNFTKGSPYKFSLSEEFCERLYLSSVRSAARFHETL